MDVAPTESAPNISVFQEIGILDRFKLQHLANSQLEITEEIYLPGISDSENKYSIFCIKTPQPQGLATFYSTVLLGGDDGNSVIGHVDFRVYSRDLKEAIADYSIYPDMSTNNSESLPSNISNAIVKLSTSSDTNAMKISENYQGKNLGSLLWAVGCGFLETQGVSEINIKDTTKQKTSSSFYEKFGAVSRPGQRVKLNMGGTLTDNIDNSQLYSPSHINIEQQNIIKSAFNL